MHLLLKKRITRNLYSSFPVSWGGEPRCKEDCWSWGAACFVREKGRRARGWEAVPRDKKFYSADDNQWKFTIVYLIDEKEFKALMNLQLINMTIESDTSVE